jgi:hypothetical protein
MGAYLTTLKGRSTQAGPEAGIEVGVPRAVARRTRPVTDLIKISPPGGLPRSAEGIEVEEGRVAGLGVGAGLQEGSMEQLLVGPSAYSSVGQGVKYGLLDSPHLCNTGGFVGRQGCQGWRGNYLSKPSVREYNCCIDEAATHRTAVWMRYYI